MPAPSATGACAHVLARYVRLALRYPVLDAPVPDLPVRTPWQVKLGRIEAGEPVEVAAWELGPFAPAGAERASRWTLHADDRLEPAPPLTPAAAPTLD